MKKTYSKPMVIIEDFSLQTSISASCELDTPLPSLAENCGYPTKGGVVFIEGTQCTTYPPEGAYNGFCYHVPTDTSNLFNS